MIEVSERTRSGCSIATVCAIIPPIDAPTRCARIRRPRASSRPTVSAAMSDSVYEADAVLAEIAPPHIGGGASVRCVERPMSRLSNRTTKQAVARPERATELSGQPIICVPRPMISRTAGRSGVAEASRRRCAGRCCRRTRWSARRQRATRRAQQPTAAPGLVSRGPGRSGPVSSGWSGSAPGRSPASPTAAAASRSPGAAPGPPPAAGRPRPWQRAAAGRSRRSTTVVAATR